MLKELERLFFVLSAKKAFYVGLACAFIFTSLLEATGIGLIGPFIYLASNPDKIAQVPLLNFAHLWLSMGSYSNTVALLGVLIVLFFLVKSYLSWKIQSYIFSFSYKQEALLSMRLMKKYMYAPYPFHLNTNSSDILNVLTSVVKKVSLGVLVPLLTCISNFVLIVILAILLFISNAVVTTVALAAILPLIYFLNLYKGRIKAWGRETTEASRGAHKVAAAALGGIKETKVIGCDEHFLNDLEQQTERYADAASSFFSFKISPRLIMEAFFISLIIGFTSVALLMQGDIDHLVSTLGIFAMASIRLIPAVSNFTNSLNNLRNSSYSIDLIYSELNTLDNLETSNIRGLIRSEVVGNRPSFGFGGAHAIKFSKSISIEQIRYTYPQQEKTAIDNVSVKIGRGQSVAFIGKSGAGKTTLIDIMLGLLTPQDGDIRVDGVSIYDDLRAWQNVIGYIPQSIFLKDDTVANNIAFGLSENMINQEQLWQVVEAAQLTDVINNLPDGINTIVGERGTRLSGGQRQRIGIARALYHGSEVLIMDEATSALDNQTESLITEAIEKMSGKRTIIVIAHRLTTVRNCDRIYMMDQGKIVKSGKYDEIVTPELEAFSSK